ncbi:MAG: hypothetical protein ACRD0P_07065 [Stackebrandtia sp.]
MTVTLLLLTTTVATIVLLTVTAAIAALSARSRRLPTAAAAALIVVPALALGGLAFAGIGVPQRLSPLVWMVLAAAPMAGGAGLLAGRSPEASPQGSLGWGLSLMLGSLVLAVPQPKPETLADQLVAIPFAGLGPA